MHLGVGFEIVEMMLQRHAQIADIEYRQKAQARSELPRQVSRYFGRRQRLHGKIDRYQDPANQHGITFRR